MKNNRFYQNANEVRRICKAQKVDVGMACDLLAQEKGWKDYHGDMLAFTALCNGYALAKYGPRTKWMDYNKDGLVSMKDLFDMIAAGNA